MQAQTVLQGFSFAFQLADESAGAGSVSLVSLGSVMPPLNENDPFLPPLFSPLSRTMEMETS
jgi:hypothetical protein